VRMIKNVVAFDAQFKPDSFRQAGPLGKGEIEVDKARAIKLVPTDVTCATEGWFRKCIRISKEHLITLVNTGIVICAGREGIPYEVAPTCDPGPLTVYAATDFKGMSRLQAGNPRELHAFEDTSQHAIAYI